jgi:hypothetical protein
MLNTAYRIYRQVSGIFWKLPLWQRILAVLALIVVHVLLILFLIYNESILGFLYPWAEKWKELNGGWIILWFMTFSTAFPPMVGYSTCLTISGFVYGFPNGCVPYHNVVRFSSF